MTSRRQRKKRVAKNGQTQKRVQTWDRVSKVRMRRRYNVGY